MRYFMATVALLVCALFAPLSARADTLTLSPTADAFVRAQAPATNFGAADFLDSHGGFSSYTCGSDGRQPGADYAYLKFDLSKVPSNAVIESATVELTSRTGFAWDGDPAQHLRFVGDDSWTEEGITYRDSPTSVDEGYLASREIYYDFPVCGDPKGAPRQQAFTSEALTSQVAAERSGDGTLSLQVFNPNCFECPAGNNLGYWVRFFSREASDATVRPKLVITYSVPQAPVLYDAVPDEKAGTTTVVGRVKGAPSTPLLVRFYSSDTCSEGQLGVEPSSLGSLRVITDETGEAYFAQALEGLPQGGFVAARTQSFNERFSPMSRCVAAPDNDIWPRARQLRLYQSEGEGNQRFANVNQSLDVDGQVRWYAFDVAPDSKLTLDLTDLPANYDLWVFKDIGAAYSEMSANTDLLNLSAELEGANSAPGAFSPGAFSPGAFSPGAFSPGAFCPGAFSPGAFSPGAFSPGAFSPGAFSPQAYANAVISSIIGGSTQEGNAPENVTINSWGNTRIYVAVTGRNGASSPGDEFDLGIAADPSTCDGIAPIGSAPAAAPGQSLKTVILTDPTRMDGSSADKSAMLAKLQTLAAKPEVAGKIVDLSQDARVAALNAQADAHNPCPFAKNLLAGAIKDVVDSYRKNNPGLAYVVVVGNDEAVPFFRYPDVSGLGPESDYVPPVLDSSASQASLRKNYVLSQDAYGSKTKVSLRQSSVPVPDLAVGRLGESPSAVSTMLDAYLGLQNGVAPQPKSSLVTGYDFLADAAHAVNDDLSAGLGSQGRKDTLITDSGVPPSDVGDPPTHSWDATRLRSQLLGSRHDIVFLAGHFSANNTLAADFTSTMDSTEIPASSSDFTNTLIFSAGCHSGYNIADQDAIPNVTVPLDWVEAFAQKGATLLAGTGYQYGDTDFLEYSERLYSNFAHDLRLGSGPVTVGSALVKAKQDYLADTPIMGGIHQKAFLEATLYGLPMFSINLPAGRIPVPSSSSIVGSTSGFTGAGPGATLGLQFANVSLTPTTTSKTKTLANLGGTGSTTASWLTGPDGVLTNPGAPALPLDRNDVTVPGQVLRGVGLRGGTFETPEPTGITPLSGAATTEQQAVHTPFAPSVFYPNRMWTVNYFGALAGPGGATTLSLTPAQYKADGDGSATALLRRYTAMDLRLYYSNENSTYPTGPNTPPNKPSLAAPPSIAQINDDVNGSTVNFRVRIVGDPAAGIQESWITYSGVHAGKWEPLDLHQSATDSTLWTATLTLPAGVQPTDVRYTVQSVNGVGLVSLDDNLGRYYTPGGAPDTGSAPTTLTFVSPPTSGPYRSIPAVSATLKDANGNPLAGKLVSFAVGSTTRSATTGSDGRATAALPLNDLPGTYRLTAGFPGDKAFARSADAVGGFTITPLAASLALSPVNTTLPGASGPTATLTAGGAPLPARTILFVLTRSDGTVALRSAKITNNLGKATLGVTGIALGQYAVDVYYGGTIADALQPITLGDPSPYTTATAHGTLDFTPYSFVGFKSPVNNPPTVNRANAGQAIPVKFSLGGNQGLNIFDPGYPKSQRIDCASGTPTDEIEQTATAGQSTLTYDTASATYTYVWKTEKAWAGTCRRLIVGLNDTTRHTADFKLK